MQLQQPMNNHKYYNFKQKLNDLPELLTLEEIEAIKTDPNKDYYMSIFRYNDQHKKQWLQNKSVKGIKDVVTDTLVWDFDSTNPELARQDTLTLARRLHETYDIDGADMHVSYSGSKGFHLILKLPENISQEQFKKATVEIAAGLKTYDPTVCDPQRILRMGHTKNLKTGLFKIPLSIDEVNEFSVDQIKELAKTARLEFTANIAPVELPKELFQVTEKKKNELKTVTDKFDPNSCPKGWKPYKWALAEGWFESGERHQALLVVAATCRALGFDKTKAYYICKDALKKQSARFGTPEFPKEELWDNIIEKSIYSDGWNGGAYSPKTNPWLQVYCEKMGFDTTTEVDEDKTYQLHDIEEEFIDFVKNIDENTILTGIPELDTELPLTVGMNLGVIGAASSGKTALALKILKNTSDADVLSVFASLDMRRNRLYEKLLYRVSGLSRPELYKRIQENNASDIFQKVRDEYKNVFFYDRSCPSVEDIRRYIARVEVITGKKVKLVMIDYFERINADKADDTAASKEIAGKLQDLVNDLNICLITLVQPNKFSLSGGPDTPILNYTSIKGSSYLYQAFRSIISIWRPFFTPELKDKDRFLQMAILKNDLGELNVFDFGWEGKRGEIWSITEEEQYELDGYLDEKFKKKNKENNESPWM